MSEAPTSGQAVRKVMQPIAGLVVLLGVTEDDLEGLGHRVAGVEQVRGIDELVREGHPGDEPMLRLNDGKTERITIGVDDIHRVHGGEQKFLAGVCRHRGLVEQRVRNIPPDGGDQNVQPRPCRYRRRRIGEEDRVQNRRCNGDHRRRFGGGIRGAAGFGRSGAERHTLSRRSVGTCRSLGDRRRGQVDQRRRILGTIDATRAVKSRRLAIGTGLTAGTA